jgi:peptidoglycan/xylan/chitin deacetylase (PgdA/CDA1 family)
MSRDPGTVFLMYHELELPGRRLCQSDPGYARYIISSAEFRQEMQQIRDLGLRGVSISDALEFSGPAVAITFDDGCETDLLSAAPVLKEFGFGATFFVVSGFVGKPGYLSREQVSEMQSLGFEIGCHSMTHPYLPDLDEAGLQREIAGAKSLLEEMLGKQVEHFSCPGGRYDARAMRVAQQAGFLTVSTSVPRSNTAQTNRWSLGRVAITRGLAKHDFEQLCRGQSLWKLELKVGVRDGMKRMLGNSVYDRLRSLVLRG